MKNSCFANIFATLRFADEITLLPQCNCLAFYYVFIHSIVRSGYPKDNFRNMLDSVYQMVPRIIIIKCLHFISYYYQHCHTNCRFSWASMFFSFNFMHLEYNCSRKEFALHNFSCDHDNTVTSFA